MAFFTLSRQFVLRLSRGTLAPTGRGRRLTRLAFLSRLVERVGLVCGWREGVQPIVVQILGEFQGTSYYVDFWKEILHPQPFRRQRFVTNGGFFGAMGHVILIPGSRHFLAISHPVHRNKYYDGDAQLLLPHQ